MADWSKMQPFRDQLDQVDEEIIKLFARRYAIRREVNQFKKANKLPLVDPVRANEVIQRARKIAAENGIPADFAAALYELVIDYSHKFEEEGNTG